MTHFRCAAQLCNCPTHELVCHLLCNICGRWMYLPGGPPAAWQVDAYTAVSSLHCSSNTVLKFCLLKHFQALPFQTNWTVSRSLISFLPLDLISPIPATSGKRQSYTLDRSHALRRAIFAIMNPNLIYTQHYISQHRALEPQGTKGCLTHLFFFFFNVVSKSNPLCVSASEET